VLALAMRRANRAAAAAAAGVQLLSLPHALSHRVMCQHGLQRATQSALRDRVFACVLGETDAATASVQRLWSHAFADDIRMSSAKRQLEFVELYQKHEYCAEGLELSAEAVAGVLALLRLQRVDCFVDLGSSEGRLPLAVAALATPPLEAAVGIELSPWRHARACTAIGRVAPSCSALALHQGDFLEGELLSRALQAARPHSAPQHAHPHAHQPQHAPARSYTFWCGLRARQGRRVGRRLLDAVQRGVSQKSGGAAATTRLLVAGFPLGRPGPALQLHAAYVFVRAAALQSGLQSGLQPELSVDTLLPLFESGQAPPPCHHAPFTTPFTTP
jgi:hypothetical protein